MLFLIRPKPTVFYRTNRFTLLDLVLFVPYALIRGVFGAMWHIFGTYATAFAVAALGLLLVGIFQYQGDAGAVWALLKTYAYTVVLFLLAVFHFLMIFVRNRKEYK